MQKRKKKLTSFWTASIQPPKGTKWRLIKTTKVMTHNPNGFQREIKIKGQMLETVENFKYLGAATISNDGSKREVLSRIAQTTATLSKLKIIWRDKNSLSWYGRSSYPFLRAGPWEQNLKEESKPLRWDAIGYFWTFPTKTMWWTRTFAAESRHDDLLILVKKRNLSWYGHISISSGMPKTILQGQWKEQGEEDRRRNGKIKTKNRREWSLEKPWRPQKTGKGGKVFVVTRRPSRLRVWGEKHGCIPKITTCVLERQSNSYNYRMYNFLWLSRALSSASSIIFHEQTQSNQSKKIRNDQELIQSDPKSVFFNLWIMYFQKIHYSDHLVNEEPLYRKNNWGDGGLGWFAPPPRPRSRSILLIHSLLTQYPISQNNM